MTDRRKIKLVQALTGAVVLTILMQGMTLLGMPQYTWMLFLPLLMFFALGANFKNIPSMVICYAVGELWWLHLGLWRHQHGHEQHRAHHHRHLPHPHGSREPL